MAASGFNEQADDESAEPVALADSGKLASEQSKWLATAAGTTVAISGAILRFHVMNHDVKAQLVCVVSALLAMFGALSSLVFGSIVQSSILEMMCSGIGKISCAEGAWHKCFRWGEKATPADHLWKQRIALYLSVLVVAVSLGWESLSQLG